MARLLSPVYIVLLLIVAPLVTVAHPPKRSRVRQLVRRWRQNTKRGVRECVMGDSGRTPLTTPIHELFRNPREWDQYQIWSQDPVSVPRPVSAQRSVSAPRPMSTQDRRSTPYTGAFGQIPEPAPQPFHSRDKPLLSLLKNESAQRQASGHHPESAQRSVSTQDRGSTKRPVSDQDRGSTPYTGAFGQIPEPAPQPFHSKDKPLLSLLKKESAQRQVSGHHPGSTQRSVSAQRQLSTHDSVSTPYTGASGQIREPAPQPFHSKGKSVLKEEALDQPPETSAQGSVRQRKSVQDSKAALKVVQDSKALLRKLDRDSKALDPNQTTSRQVITSEPNSDKLSGADQAKLVDKPESSVENPFYFTLETWPPTSSSYPQQLPVEQGSLLNRPLAGAFVVIIGLLYSTSLDRVSAGLFGIVLGLILFMGMYFFDILEKKLRLFSRTD